MNKLSLDVEFLSYSCDFLIFKRVILMKNKILKIDGIEIFEATTDELLDVIWCIGSQHMF